MGATYFCGYLQAMASLSVSRRYPSCLMWSLVESLLPHLSVVLCWWLVLLYLWWWTKSAFFRVLACLLPFSLVTRVWTRSIRLLAVTLVKESTVFSTVLWIPSLPWQPCLGHCDWICEHVPFPVDGYLSGCRNGLHTARAALLSKIRTHITNDIFEETINKIMFIM